MPSEASGSVLPPPLAVQNCRPFKNHIAKKQNHIDGNLGHFFGILRILEGETVNTKPLVGSGMSYKWWNQETKL